MVFEYGSVISWLPFRRGYALHLARALDGALTMDMRFVTSTYRILLCTTNVALNIELQYNGSERRRGAASQKWMLIYYESVHKQCKGKFRNIVLIARKIWYQLDTELSEARNRIHNPYLHFSFIVCPVCLSSLNIRGNNWVPAGVEEFRISLFFLTFTGCPSKSELEIRVRMMMNDKWWMSVSRINSSINGRKWMCVGVFHAKCMK